MSLAMWHQLAQNSKNVAVYQPNAAVLPPKLTRAPLFRPVNGWLARRLVLPVKLAAVKLEVPRAVPAGTKETMLTRHRARTFEAPPIAVQLD
jgi:hypothetical protein